MEHRLGHRQEIDEAVTLRIAGGMVRKAVLTDLSFSGGFVRTSVRVPVQTPLTIGWARSNKSAASSAVIGHVVRHCHTGMGIEWRDFAPYSVSTRLNRLWLIETMSQLQK